MKNSLKIIFIINFLFLPAFTYAAAHSYHVTQKGAGQRTGKNIANAWSVSDFNNAENWSTNDHENRIDPGDTVYFSGTITSALNLQGSGSFGNYITLDGYQSDDTTYQNLSESGGRAKIDRTLSDSYGIRITGKDYVTVCDFEITDVKQAISIDSSSDNIIVKRTYIYECNNGIVINKSSNVTIGGSPGQGNVVKNVGNTTAHEDIAITGSGTPPHDIIISYNHLYADDDTSWGIDGIMNVGNKTYDVLIEYNSIHGHNHSTAKGENGIDLKRDISNVIIRYNEIYDHDWEPEILINTSAYGGGDNIYIYGNYIHDGGSAGISHDMDSKGISINCHGSTTIFNNTVAENDSGASSSDAGVYISSYGIPNTALKNNIFYKNCPTGSKFYPAYSISNGADEVTTADYNHFDWPGQTPQAYWGNSGWKNLAGLQSGAKSGLPQEANGSEGTSGMTDPDNNDYTISEGATVIDGGVDMGSGAIATITIQGTSYQVNWDVALGPKTDWSGTIPSIDVQARDIVGWDQGAYAYLAIQARLAAPRSLKIVAD
jgi:hypothetical protein